MLRVQLEPQKLELEVQNPNFFHNFLSCTVYRREGKKVGIKLAWVPGGKQPAVILGSLHAGQVSNLGGGQAREGGRACVELGSSPEGSHIKTACRQHASNHKRTYKKQCLWNVFLGCHQLRLPLYSGRRNSVTQAKLV